MGIRILVVDDEPDFRDLLDIILQKKGYTVDTACSGEDAIDILKEKEYDIVLTDMKMKNISGLQVLEYIKENSPITDCIIITAYGSVASAVEAMKIGAFSYFIKSSNPQELLFDIEKIIKIKNLSVKNHILSTEINKTEFMLSTSSPKFLNTLECARKVSETDSSVLILGESGVGKEVVARYIHNNSGRSSEIFLPINCYSLSETLLESELYGHEKGSFTGSDGMRKGRFESSDKGTLFLDEIGDVPMSTQTKLLRNIENKEIQRLGSNTSINVDFRLITATNKNLKEEILNKNFREDFYYRINTVIIEVPPLRERKEDLPMLIEFFLEKVQMELKKSVSKIDEEVMEVLLDYDYPGNIRELKNIIERLVVFADDGVISKRILGFFDLLSLGEEDVCGKSLKEVRSVAEKTYISKVLKENEFSIDATAKVLEISGRQLYNKIKEYKI